MTKIRMAKPRIKPVAPRVAPLSRGDRRARGYDSEWYRAVAVHKRTYPWCAGCVAAGLGMVPSEVVDHIEPHQGDRIKFWNRLNWQACCAWHHNAIKPRLEAMWSRGEIGVADLRLGSSRAVALTLDASRSKPRAVRC